MILVSLKSLRYLLRSVTNLIRSRAWAYEIWPRKQRLPECFSMTEGHFSIEIPAWSGEILEIQELHVIAECVLFLKILNLRINSQWAEKTLCMKVISREEKTCRISCTISLLSLIFPRTVDIAPGVGFRWSWYPWKACDVFFRVSQISWELKLGPVRYHPTNKDYRSIFPWRMVIFRSRFRPN